MKVLGLTDAIGFVGAVEPGAVSSSLAAERRTPGPFDQLLAALGGPLSQGGQLARAGDAEPELSAEEDLVEMREPGPEVSVAAPEPAPSSQFLLPGLNFASTAPPPDPRRVSVDGSEGLDPMASRRLTAREPGSRAWGLRLDSTRPGGAGVELKRFQTHSTVPGSRGFRPADLRTSSLVQAAAEFPHSTAAEATDPVDAVMDRSIEGLREDPVAEGSRPTATSEVAEAREPTADRMGRRAATVAERLDPRQRRVVSSAVEQRSPVSVDPSAAEGVLDLGTAAESVKADLPRSSAAPAPAPPAQPPAADPAEARLPPVPTTDGPVRVQVDADLTVEIDSHDGVIDVVLEGDEQAIEPLRDLGPALEEELDQHGWNLGQFDRREHPDARRDGLHRGRIVAAPDPAPAEDTPRRSRVRKGQIVDIVA